MNKKKIISVVMTLALVLCSSITAFAGIDYSQWNSGGNYPSDITNTEYFTAVKILMDRGVITGDSDGLFHPQKNISRAEFAVIMAKSTNNANNLDSLAKENNFSDLSGYDWAKSYINAVAKAGIMQGVGNGKYEPWRNVTYAEVMTAILRATNSSYNQIVATGTWPENIINHVQMYNLTGDTSITDWTAAATKGNVAKLVYRNMPKGSTDAAYADLPNTINATSGAVTLSVASGASGVTTTYQWYKNGSAIAGATSNSLIINGPVKNDRYYVVVKTQKVGYKETTVTSNTCTVN